MTDTNITTDNDHHRTDITPPKSELVWGSTKISGSVILYITAVIYKDVERW